MYGILQPGPDVRSGVPYVRPTEIQGDEIQLGDVKRTTEQIAATYKRSSLKYGDVLLSIVGTIGKVAIVPKALEGGNITQSSVRIRPSAVTSSSFLRVLLKSPQLVRQYDELRLGTGVPRLNVGDVRELICPLPPLNEQRRIVAKLEALQARSRRAREALDAIPLLLEKLRQSILAAAFRGDLTKDWRAKHPDVESASELLKRIRVERRKKWEEAELAKMKAKGKVPADDRWKTKYKEPEAGDTTGLPQLPSGWCWTSFETVAEVTLGRQRAPQYQTGRFTRPYLRVANIKDGYIDFSDVLEMDFDDEDYEFYRLTKGDVLLSEGQSPELVGQSAIYDGQVKGLCFQKTLHRFRAYEAGPSSQYSQLLFSHYLRSGLFRSVASLTVNIAHLTLVRLKPLHFPLLPKEEETELVLRATAALQRVADLETSLADIVASVQKLDRSTLAKAFRGELLPQDPNDEPADVMLARLKAQTNGATERPSANKQPTKRLPGYTRGAQADEA